MTRFLALLLLLGSLLLLAGAALHPILPLTAEGDLELIAATGRWALVHYTLLHATGLVIAGIWAIWLAAPEASAPEARRGLAVACAVFGVGQALNGVNIAYMTGAGTMLAALAPDPGLATTYHAMHLFAVMCGRLAGFLVSIAAFLFALATPRPLSLLAGFAGVAGLLGNFLAPPGHPLMLTSVGLLAAWQAVMAGQMLRRPGR